MLSVIECAKLLGVSAARVRQLVSSGILPARKVGKVWVIREEDALNRLESHAGPGRPRVVATDCGKSAAPVADRPDTTSAADEFARLFDLCSRNYASCPSAAELQSYGDPEIAAFRAVVSDFFLKQKQLELIEQGVF